MDDKDINFTLFENTIPYFVEDKIRGLYNSIYSSLTFMRISESLASGVFTYIAECKGDTLAILLFRIKGRLAVVVNEVLEIDEKEIERFSRFIFKSFEFVDLIEMNRINTNIQRVGFPFQQIFQSEDYIIDLPQNADEYLLSLGKSTRKNLKRHLNKLKRNHPSVGIEVYVREEVREQDLRRIIELNRLRINGRREVWSLSDKKLYQLLDMVRSDGMIVVLNLDGKICAGEICSFIEKSYFSHVGAHDPAYDSYSLGMLSCYFLICECIKQGARDLHLLWGNYDYKVRLGGTRYDLQKIKIYRSYAQMLLHGPIALKTAILAHIFNIRRLGAAQCGKQNKSQYVKWTYRALTFLSRIYRRVRFASLWCGVLLLAIPIADT